MGLQGEKKLEDILTGALIGLARTTYSHLKTENTDRVVTCALSVLVRVDADEKELEKQLEQVRAEKLAVAPGCATCVAKCGNTDDYDMDRFWNGPVQVRSLKIRLFSGLKKTGRDVFKVIENGNEIKNLLINQVKSSVRWSETIEKMLDEGIDTFIEIGPLKTLSSFVREISKEKKATVKIFNVEDLKSLNKTLEGMEAIC